MLDYNYDDPQVQAAMLTGLFQLGSAVVAAVAAALIGRVIANRRKLQEELDAATSDIAFLLEVERLHCDKNKEQHGASRKNIVRDQARASGVNWSGKFTRSRIKNGD